jgi:phosphatidylglycerol:prolipoprotein diacylglycerol transferase
MMYIGLVAGIVVGNIAAHAAGIDAFRTYAATLLLIGPALIGSRLLHVALHWRFYRHNLRQIWVGTEGGGAQYGGLPIILPLSVPLLWALRLPFGAFWDVAMFTILVTMIFGRIGCLLNSCCAGRPSKSWISLNLPNHSGVWERRIPRQCLEAGWAAVLLVFALYIWRWLPFPGALFLLITGSYAAGRLVLESTREPQPGAGRFNIHQWMSVAIMLLSLAGLTAAWPK